jgi:hypothetical protein
LLLGGSDVRSQDALTPALSQREREEASVLPKYPTSKRQVMAQEAVGVAATGQSSLKWRAPSATSEVQPVQPSMNLRVGASVPSGVVPAIALVAAEEIIATSDASPAPPVRLAQDRSRFQLQPPSRFPSATSPDVIDGEGAFSAEVEEPAAEPEEDPLFRRPLTGDPSLDVPSEAEPAPAELPLEQEGLPDPGAARDFNLGMDNDREQMPCRENYRDTNCCEQNSDCHDAWSKLEANPIRLFTKGFLDITPLYRPDVRYSGKEQIDQEKARAEGLAINSLRVWKNVNGKPLGLSEDGTVLGLDGEDWLREWEDASRKAEMEIGGLRPSRPVELKGRATDYKPGASEVTVTTETGEAITLPLDKLSVDDHEWLNGRTWRDAEGRQLARGRFYDFEWNRILVQESSGRIAAVPYNKLSEMDLCYVGAYWGEGVGLPAECRLRGKMQIRNFTMITYTWKASGLCHKPLYFEEVQLERYGHTFGPVAQPFVSGAHFFANIAILPYKMGINPPNECQYALGYYRPGDCAPYMIPPVPLSARGGLYQAGAVVGAVALFP